MKHNWTTKYELNEKQNDFLAGFLFDLANNTSYLELGDLGYSNVPGEVNAHVYGSVHYTWFAEQRQFGNYYKECPKHLFIAQGYSDDDYKVLRSLKVKNGPIRDIYDDDLCLHINIDLSVWKDVDFSVLDDNTDSFTSTALGDNYYNDNAKKLMQKWVLPIKIKEQDEQKAIDKIVHKTDDFFGEWFECGGQYSGHKTRDFDSMVQHVVSKLDRFDYNQQCMKKDESV